MEDLIKIRKYLEDLCADEGSVLKNTEDQGGLPSDQTRYIFEDMGPSMIRRMCRERSKDE